VKALTCSGDDDAYNLSVMPKFSYCYQHLLDNRALDINRLTALEVGLFDKNTALENLYVESESGTLQDL
jgi:hypothetical protein